MRDKRDTAAGRLFAMPFAGGSFRIRPPFLLPFWVLPKGQRPRAGVIPPPAAFLFWGIRKVRDACRRSAQILRYSPF